MAHTLPDVRHVIVWEAEARHVDPAGTITVNNVDNEDATPGDMVYDTETQEYLNVVEA